ncbi:hypothetical protein [Trichormus sp. NMC-1]|uniref:hypothetical protein n=1 Tax=Trichormus sp. NMC-1 TaxID=1853259 RepID=UPI0008DC2A12|nr:hypothetical protein [Trichormus sp. NMC-1]
MTNQPTKIQNSVQLKNHVSRRGQRLGQALSSKFGVSLADFDKIMSGDIATAQKIGELARQGRYAAEFAPKIAQAYKEIMEGSQAYNQAIADILTQAGKSGIAIDKVVGKTTLSNTRYIHERKELAQQFVFDKNAENVRHEYQLNYGQMKGYLDAHFTAVDQQIALLEQSNRPEVKQISADEQRQNKLMNEALASGDNARYDLIPEKKYNGGFKAKLIELKTALGF